MTHAVFAWPVRVYWEDTDAGGVVYYANYLKFLERGRTEWLRHLGWSQSILKKETGGVFVVSEIQTQYLRSAVLDDLLEVTTVAQQIGKASLTVVQSIFRYDNEDNEGELALQAKQDHLLCQATVRLGWVNSDTMSPSRIPSDILQSMRSS